MAIGPVQLLVLGFKEPNFQGEIRAELDRLRDNDLVRVLDALAVRKTADGRSRPCTRASSATTSSRPSAPSSAG